MEIDHEALLKNALYEGVREGIKAKMTGYNGPINTLIETSLKRHGDRLQAVIDEAVVACSESEEWRQAIKKTARETMAKVLIQKVGGEIEKQVNALKSNPVTRAKITTAIDEIIKAPV